MAIGSLVYSVLVEEGDGVEIEGGFEEEEEDFFDAKNGLRMDNEKVHDARKEEMNFVKNIDLFDVRDVEECVRETGKAPVTTRWVDGMKKADGEEFVRSRWVARDFKVKGERDREDLFAAMPPLEAKKCLFIIAVAMRRKWRGRRKVRILFLDVRKAHMNPRLKESEKVYVDLPEGFEQEGKCARLKRWLYGMRPAAQAWEEDYTAKMESIGCKKGQAAVTCFYNAETQIRCVVHGDDFTVLGFDDELDKIEEHFRGWYDVKVRGRVGADEGDLHEMTILNRKIRWQGDVLEYEADPEHANVMKKVMGLEEDSKGVKVSCVKETKEEEAEEDQELRGDEVRTFRSVAARGNYLGQDRMDLQFAAKEVCRKMSKPTKKGLKKMKRMTRYLIAVPRVVWRFREEKGERAKKDVVNVYSDSDWAGCRETRKSTSGGVAVLGGCAVKSWASTQGVIAQSSGEAEYYAMTRAAAEGLGIQALLQDLGWEADVVVHVDSTAAKAIASRVGLGRVRHLEVRFLWLQQAVRRGRIVLKKVHGEVNPADALTKPLGFEDMVNKMKLVGGELIVTERSGTA
jgi:hypothetical protein